MNDLFSDRTSQNIATSKLVKKIVDKTVWEYTPPSHLATDKKSF